MKKWCCIPLGLSVNGDDRDCLLPNHGITTLFSTASSRVNFLQSVTQKGLQPVTLSLLASPLSEYSPHHCFCSLLYQDIVCQIIGKKSIVFCNVFP